MKVWITKYALTKGIIEMEVELCENPQMVKEAKTEWGNYFHTNGVEWHSNKETAIVKAEEMRMNKLKSLQKQIDKLNKLSFK